MKSTTSKRQSLLHNGLVLSFKISNITKDILFLCRCRTDCDNGEMGITIIYNMQQLSNLSIMVFGSCRATVVTILIDQSEQSRTSPAHWALLTCFKHQISTLNVIFGWFFLLWVSETCLCDAFHMYDNTWHVHMPCHSASASSTFCTLDSSFH